MKRTGKKRRQPHVQDLPSAQERPPPASPAPKPARRGLKRLVFLVGPVVILAACILVTYGWVISDTTNPRFLGASDCWAYYGPVSHFLDNRIHHGEFPLWNPLYLCGQPHAANPQSWVFYPPNLVRSLLTFNPTPMKTHVGIAWMIFFHLMLGGISTFFLARRHGFSFGASLTAAFAFTFSAALVTRSVGHWVFNNTVAWFPLMLLLLREALTARQLRQKTSFAIGAGLAWGMAILGGTPSLMVLIGVSAPIYAILFRILYPAAGAEKETAAVPRKMKRLEKILVRDSVVLVLLFAIGLLIAAPLLLPGAQFSSLTERGEKDTAANEDLVKMHSDPWTLFKVLAIYQGHGHYEGLRASGAIVLMLALAAVICRPRRHAVLFGVLFLILLDCSLSQQFLFGRVVGFLTPFTASNPGRVMTLACLPLGLLAAAGADALLTAQPSMRWRMARSAVVLVLGLAVVFTVALAARPEPLLPVGPLVVILPAIACAVMLAGGWLPKPALWSIVLAGLVFAETIAWNVHLIPSIVSVGQIYNGPMDTLNQPKTFWADNRRGTYVQANVPLYNLKPAINGYDPLQIREVRDILCLRRMKKVLRRIVFNFEVASNNMRGNLFLKRQFWLARRYVDGPLPAGAFPVTTTVFVENQGELPLPKVNPADLPRIGLSRKTSTLWVTPPGSPPHVLKSESFTGPTKVYMLKPVTIPPKHSSMFVKAAGDCKMEVRMLFRDLKQNKDELGKTIVLLGDNVQRLYEVPLPDFQNLQIAFAPDFKNQNGQFSIQDIRIESDLNDEDALISVAARTANTVQVDLRDLPDRRMLVCVDAFYPGWRAYMDGSPARIYKVDGAFKGVMVPPGSHRVTFTFRPARVYAGIAVSLLTLVGVTLASILLLRSRPRAGEAVAAS